MIPRMTYDINLQIMSALLERVKALDIVKSPDIKIFLIGVLMICQYRGEELHIYIDIVGYDNIVAQFGNTCKLRESLHNPRAFDMVIETITSYYQSFGC